MSVGQYLATRVSSLKPAMAPAPNPIKLLRMLTKQNWAFFAVAFVAWVSCCPVDYTRLNFAHRPIH